MRKVIINLNFNIVVENEHVFGKNANKNKSIRIIIMYRYISSIYIHVYIYGSAGTQRKLPNSYKDLNNSPDIKASLYKTIGNI